ncbi:MipA/OmpV family protein [Methylophilus sp.]|uniref:MipA/OmpV family protein n=1 Tax=Methylophilus sp. TaxID=29541 RepID=UPI004034FB9F
MDYFNGAGSSEVLMERPAYKADGAINIDLGLRGTYVLHKQHSMFLHLAFARLSREIKASPRVVTASHNLALFTCESLS